MHKEHDKLTAVDEPLPAEEAERLEPEHAFQTRAHPFQTRAHAFQTRARRST